MPKIKTSQAPAFVMPQPSQKDEPQGKKRVTKDMRNLFSFAEDQVETQVQQLDIPKGEHEDELVQSSSDQDAIDNSKDGITAVQTTDITNVIR